MEPLLDPIQKILEAYKAAIYAKDVEAFLAIYDKNIEVFDMWGASWSYQGIESWREMAKGWFGSLRDERVAVELEDARVKRTGEMAFVSAFVKYTALSAAGEPLRWLQNRMTFVLEPQEGVWKITHEHTSAPADHATLKVSLRR